MHRFFVFTVLFMTIACGVVRGQQSEPKFQSHEISFKSTGNIAISGSLTLPNGEGPFPAIVLLGGSERLGRTGFYNWSNADAFVERGVAVFSFDSPGRGKSEGSRWGRTHKERTDDALAAIKSIAKRPDINGKLIGLYGGSEGGGVAFRAAAQSKSVAFVITVSAPVVSYGNDLDNKVEMLCLLSGLQGEKLDKLVTFNRLSTALALRRSSINVSDLTKTAERWNDPNWSKLIRLLENQTTQNREATKDSFVEIAKNWESTDWFQTNRKLRMLQEPFIQLLGIDLLDVGIDLDEPLTARSLVEFDSGVLAKLGESDSPNAMLLVSDSSRDEDPLPFLRKITCPMLCIYGEVDHEMKTYPKIVRGVVADTKHSDATVKVFKGAGHQLEVTNGKRIAAWEFRKYRHKDVDPLILDWVLKRTARTP